MRAFFKKFAPLFDAYPNLWVKGGGARDALLTLYADKAKGFERATRSMRDIDLVLIGGTPTEKQQLLGQFGGLIKSEDLDIRASSLDQYFKTRDVGINEVALRPDLLLFTNKALNDLTRGVVNPSGGAFNPEWQDFSPRIALRALLFALREGLNPSTNPMLGEALSAARPFDLLIHLYKAFETGTADEFYEAVRDNPNLRGTDSAEEALLILSEKVYNFERSPSQQRIYEDARSIVLTDRWGQEEPPLSANSRSRRGRDLGAVRVAARYRLAKSLLPGGVGRRMKPSDFDRKELEMGIKVEQEHLVGARYSESDARMLAQEIAMDHLTEMPDYYTRLKAVEGETGPDAVKKDKKAAYFNVGDPILYGKFQNKPGTIVRIWADDRGVPMIEIEPTPKGRKKNRVMGLFRIRHNRALTPPVTDTAIKVAARYKEKKKVKTKDGDEATVYVYSERQVANRNREKAGRIDTLRKNHADLLDQIKKDLDSDDAKTRLTALAVGLIDNTYERVGNDDSADDGHFGVTGWQKKHMTFSKGKVVIKYVGKSGVKHEKIVSDADLLRVLKDCCDDKDPDDPIFGFPHEEGVTKITSRDVNDYLAEYDITAKDLRGYHANREMQEQLRAVRKKGPELPRDRKEKDKILKAEFKEALEAVAEAVGHEPSTLRSQYLVPWLEDTYMKNGDVIDRLDKQASVGKHVLPPLPYAYDALEPHISEETLKFHHDKHHKAYVDGLNKAEKQIAAARADEDYEAIPAFNAAMEFNSGGHVLHTLYWPSLVPTDDYEEPSDELVDAIEADFGSWDAFRSQMKESTIKVRGSGWGVLVLTPAGLRVVTVMNHENGVLWDGIALLPIDAWEHAYYLDYQNDREAHFDAVFDNLVNWPVIERRLNDARAVKRVARGKAKKDVGHGGLDEWFSGHGGATGKGEEARWGDWVAISPVKKTLDSGKKVEPGDIVGPCGISDDPDWEDTTKDGKDPLKCMPREKAHDMPKKERAEKARAKMRAERSEGNEGKKPTHTPTFDKKADSENEPTNEDLWEKSKATAKDRYGKWPSAYAVGHALKIYKEKGGGWRKKKASYGSLNDEAQAILDRGSRLWPLDQFAPPLITPPADDSKTVANEVAELIRFSSERPAYRKLIESLDRDFPLAFIHLCAQLGVPCDEHRIGELVEESKPVILALKAFYNRSRPFQVSPDINPIASDTTQTPSYPSGHTTQAWLIAHDLAVQHPEHREAFFDLARLVAKTRLLGGVHFRSDNEYAEVLAGSMAGWLRRARVATKTDSEREDEQAERLIAPAPKKKPPRKDLKRRRVEDSDTGSDPDKDQDRKDRSQNYKDASASGRNLIPHL